MREPLHIRVFELQGDQYQLCKSFKTFEEYVLEELQDGYILTQFQNFGIEKLQVITYYSPVRAKQYLDAGSMVSNLADVPAEEV